MKLPRLKAATRWFAEQTGMVLHGQSKWDKARWLKQCHELADLYKLHRSEPVDLDKVCGHCAGTGKYQFGNGRTGECYQCKGKRFQDADDVKRNACYARHNG